MDIILTAERIPVAIDFIKIFIFELNLLENERANQKQSVPQHQLEL